MYSTSSSGSTRIIYYYHKKLLIIFSDDVMRTLPNGLGRTEHKRVHSKTVGRRVATNWQLAGATSITARSPHARTATAHTVSPTGGGTPNKRWGLLVVDTSGGAV
uniref:Uncharacterized protein n=1 Tax=Sipha flava TaxID=143950 RepID=A0A2S2QQV7_9HEMI